LDFAVKRRLADQTIVELMDEEDRLRAENQAERERIARLQNE
jgi:hypothetical protein